MTIFGVNGCTPPKPVSCYIAAKQTHEGNCFVNGSVYQHDTIFEVVPEGRSPDEERLIGILSPDRDIWPKRAFNGMVATIEYCGPYSKELGEYALLEITPNSEGTYSGHISIDTCGG